MPSAMTSTWRSSPRTGIWEPILKLRVIALVLLSVRLPARGPLLKAFQQADNFPRVSSPPPNDSQTPEQRARQAARPLKWLLALSLLLPIAILTIAGWISYKQHLVDARDRLDRDLGRIYEHALKVFETFDLSARYVDQ